MISKVWLSLKIKPNNENRSKNDLIQYRIDQFFDKIKVYFKNKRISSWKTTLFFLCYVFKNNEIIICLFKIMESTVKVELNQNEVWKRNKVI